MTIKQSQCYRHPKSQFFFFLIDKQPNILEKAKKPHVYREYTEQPYTRLEKNKKGEKKTPPNLTHPQVVPSHSKITNF